MKLIFICAPYSRLDENYFKSINYCQYVIKKGFIPLNTITMYHGVLDERIPQDYKIIADANKNLIKYCDEVWVFGPGAESLIADAVAIGKPVKYIDDTFTKSNCSESLVVVEREYKACMSKEVNGQIRQDILYYLNEGLSPELIIEVIRKTARIQKQWNWSLGVLRNCRNEGKTTADEFLNKKPKSGDSIAAYDLDLFERMLNSKDKNITFDIGAYEKMLNEEDS